MGAEGYITVSRISKGHELLGAQSPAFKVTEPVALLLCSRSSFAGLPAFDVDSLGVLRYISPRQEVALLTENGAAAVGLIVVPKRELDRLRERDKDQYRFTPGAYSQEHFTAWEKITNGIWLITYYYENGTEWDEHIADLPKGIETDLDVEYEIWT